MTLYELTGQYRPLYEMLSAGDIDEQTFRDTIESCGLDEAIEDKADNYAYVIKQMEADVSVIEQEVARLNARKYSLVSNAQRVRHNLQEAMYAIGKTRIHTPRFTFNVQPNPPSVVIDADAQLPDEFMRVIPERREPDKTAIKDALKEGRAVEGCRLEQKESLRIR